MAWAWRAAIRRVNRQRYIYLGAPNVRARIRNPFACSIFPSLFFAARARHQPKKHLMFRLHPVHALSGALRARQRWRAWLLATK